MCEVLTCCTRSTFRSVPGATFAHDGLQQRESLPRDDDISSDRSCEADFFQRGTTTGDDCAHFSRECVRRSATAACWREDELHGCESAPGASIRASADATFERSNAARFEHVPASSSWPAISLAPCNRCNEPEPAAERVRIPEQLDSSELEPAPIRTAAAATDPRASEGVESAGL